ncbi:MAG: SPOR domain-containing protein [SAR324 cluster bacterium]|nr:SPOR domain-containing protein [SAR324 cluster bacterium]
MAKKKKKKGGFFKFLFFLLLITGTAAAATHFYWDKVPRKYRDQFARNYKKVDVYVKALDIQVPDIDELKSKIPKFDFLENKKEKLKTNTLVLEELPPTRSEIKAEAKKVAARKAARIIRPQQGERLYYIRVGQCIFKTCIKDLTRAVKRLGMPYKITKKNNKETHFELISANSYREDIAYAKLEKLEKYNKMNFTASMAGLKNGEFRITFGSFPVRDRAVQLGAYLRQLHSDINLRFIIEPRTHWYRSTAVYTGPFTSLFNAKNAASALRRQETFDEAKITTKL